MSVDAQIEEVPRICEWVTNLALKAGMPQQEAYRVELAVDEVCTNIIEHGTGQLDRLAGCTSNTIEVRCQSNGVQFLTVIIDDCPPFNPLEQSDPDPAKPLDQRPENGGGWGVYFVKALMDQVQYEYRTPRNYLYMLKRI